MLLNLFRVRAHVESDDILRGAPGERVPQMWPGATGLRATWFPGSAWLHKGPKGSVHWHASHTHVGGQVLGHIG